MSSHKKIYFQFILLGSTITCIMFVIQAKFILKIQHPIYAYGLPLFVGILFGYLIARVIILNDQYKRLASTDHLTQLSDRNKFYELVQREILRYERYKNPFSIILLDVDHFKTINDTLGHQVGDSVLVNFPKIFKKECRKSDLCARWGGEEFIILHPETDLSAALRSAERFRSEIEKNSFQIPQGITCSFGVAQYNSTLENFDALIEHADRALYRAKECGRNRVETIQQR